MDDGEVEISNSTFLPNATSVNNTIRDDDAMIDEYLKHITTCTHTHTCNPPGPDATHTHTCYHTHTQVISSGDETKTNSLSPSLKLRRPLGNRVAVRKYREKKKAHTAYLEEEVKKLRLVNQQLVRKVQGQAALEAEALRLKSLLIDLRGKIDMELGQFPFQKQCSFNSSISIREGGCGIQSTDSNGAIGVHCQPDTPCYIPVADGGGGSKPMYYWGGDCQMPMVDCHVNGNGIVAGSDHQLEAVEAVVANENQA